jgi:ATP-dependent Lon protease
MKADGTYPKGSINFLVNEKLKALAEGLKKFGSEEDKNSKKKSGRKTKSKPKK